MIPRVSSILWGLGWLLLAWWLYSTLSVIRDFDGSSFEVHNQSHWFRRVAIPCFYSYSMWPSLAIILLILFRGSAGRGRVALTVVLAAVCVFLFAVGVYTVWEQTAVIHQFVL